MATPAFAWMPLAAFTDRRLGARDLRILGVLYAHAGADRVCWPAVATLARLTGIDRRDVQRTLRRLEDFGWVRVEAGGGRSATSRYRLWQAEGGAATGEAPAESAAPAGEPTAGETPAETPERAGESPPQGRVIHRSRAGEAPARTYQNSSGNRDLLGDPEASVAETRAGGEPGRESALLASFTDFWAAYPRRRGKADALKAWKALKPDAALVARLLEALALARASPDWRRQGGRFIPYPATWLRRRGWEDELEADIDPLPEPRHGDGQRISSTVAALDSLFGGRSDGDRDLSEGHDLPGVGLRAGDLPRAGGRLLGSAGAPGGRPLPGGGEGPCRP